MTTFRTSAPPRPYAHTAKPQRETDRRRMHGDLLPANDNAHRRERIRNTLELLVMILAAMAIGAMLAVGHS